MAEDIDQSTAPPASPQPPSCLILYDGDCAFCRRRIAMIQRLDRAGRFEYAPMQDRAIRSRFSHVDPLEPRWGLRLIDEQGRIAVGADGVYEICRRLPRLQRLAWVYRVPGLRGLLRAAYWLIARHRRRLG
ncbi:MAG: DUF393 domain-containing protein [Candidatus Sumerlaeota bacterium]|nr:DUF393 domain-containing protein [Candidatus Sumerlaeota bacterium]